MILNADALNLPIASKTVQCCVTSPPYYGLRDYGMSGQLGLEPTPEEYVANLVSVFREVWRVMKNDGTLWVNLGDSFAGSGKGAWNKTDVQKEVYVPLPYGLEASMPKVPPGCKHKDLIGIPWMVAFALRADGWYLRSDIIWSKPNPMPESVTDRPTKAHEYLFLLTKSAQYYYDNEAIKEPCKWSSIERLGQDIDNQKGSDRANGGAKTNGTMKAVVKEWNPSMAGGAIGIENRKHLPYPMANKRTVWEIPTQPTREAHFATYPEKLVEPCILAGSRPGDLILDPFAGSGTTGRVAIRHNRQFIGTELNFKYIAEIAPRRLTVQPMIAGVA
jgi:DNA modification methylase